MAQVTVTGVGGLPEITAGSDLAALIADAAGSLRDGDIVVITSKIVSKAEGRVVRGSRDRAIDAETVRVVARRGDARIVETRHGLVLAAAGVDASNTSPGTVVLLPVDPDASARGLRKALHDGSGATVGVIVTDTLGRPWRAGQTDNAIGAAGVLPAVDYRGGRDTFGNPLEVTLTAVADEIAGAADLVKRKTGQVPVAIVRGLADLVTAEDGPGARALIRPAAEDMFRFGSAEVPLLARPAAEFTAEPVDPAAVRRGVSAALAAATPLPADPSHVGPVPAAPWRFVLVQSASRKAALLDAVRDASLADPSAPLRTAPLVILPCLIADAGDRSLAAGRAGTGNDTTVAALGAAVQNLLIALAVEGFGSCWITGTPFYQDVAARALDLPAGWQPIGAIGVGRPAVPAPDRPPRNPDDFILTL